MAQLPVLRMRWLFLLWHSLAAENSPRYTNLRCVGPILDTATVNGSQQCSVLCDNEPECKTWSLYNNGSCVLQKYCRNFVPTRHGRITDVIPSLPRTLHCSVPEKGVWCKNNNIATGTGMSLDACCHFCAATPGCLMYTLIHRICHLKSSCPEKTYMGEGSGYSTGYMQRPAVSTYRGYHRVGRGIFNVSGYVCGMGEATSVIFYPRGPGPFGVVIHRAGFDGGVDLMDDWLETIASMGIIVLAPFTSSGGCGNVDPEAHAWMDTVTIASEAISKGALLHPALAHADWHRLGLSGHSMGAQAAIEAAHFLGKQELFAYARNVTVLAVLASHDAVGSISFVDPDIALMLTTGSNDSAFPPHKAEEFFNQSRSRFRILASMYQAHHMEPYADIHFEEMGFEGGGARENWWTSQFLSCHIMGHEHHCRAVYGRSNDSMRYAHHWSLLRIHNHSQNNQSTDSHRSIDNAWQSPAMLV